jgi:hypothetical protein
VDFSILQTSGLTSGKESNDFGLTLAKYGVEEGPYLVLPILYAHVVCLARAPKANLWADFGLPAAVLMKIFADPKSLTARPLQQNCMILPLANLHSLAV